MSKGSARRSGEGYQDSWDLIFGKREPITPLELNPITDEEMDEFDQAILDADD